MINREKGRHPFTIQVEDFIGNPEKMKNVLGFPLSTTHPSKNGATYKFCGVEFTYDFYDKKREWYKLTITTEGRKRETKKGIPYMSKGGSVDWGVFIKQNNLEAIAFKESIKTNKP